MSVDDELPKGTRTRRHAVWLGAIVFPATTLAIFLIGYLYLTHKGVPPSDPFGTGRSGVSGPNWAKMACSFAACLPPSILVGMLAGFDAYRYAAGSRVMVGPLVLLVFTVPFLAAESGITLSALAGVLAFSAMQYFHRAVATIFVEFELVAFPLFYLTIIVFSAPLDTSSDGLSNLHGALSNHAATGLFLSDAVVAGRVRRWANAGRIDTECGARLQFSLRTMLLLFAAWTLYLSILAWMFTNKLR